ncbi:hypothetical protein K2173_015840 [Erythroxylum novogranatense]|uniref:Protein MULTIPOLAR SPINDLE 1 n=1 Tax=Erythroxylum novogranatense TaxID=1862640 RepID=A0AAV8SF54_9ROSI|nr:hypothetical protein K2173_015840 [Erythroxylum novogranatense]
MEAATSSQQVTNGDQSLKLAVAVALLRSKLLHKQPSQSDATRWKLKETSAKERKQEILRLREDLKEAEDASRFDLFPNTASCKCYFFHDLGKLHGDSSPSRFNDVLRRRFLRQVRLRERRKRSSDSNQRRCFSDFDNVEEEEQLRASVDFLVDLCDSTCPTEEINFANWSHQAVDFILASLRNLLSARKNMERLEGIVSCLIVRLVRRMCSLTCRVKSLNMETDAFYVQHLIRQLGGDSYIGQRAILSIAQRISLVAENLLPADPFEDGFTNMHESLFIMIQLIEFLVCDNLLTWAKDDKFDTVLFEEWVASVHQARKALELLESRNGLYVLYMDRVTGELQKQIGQASSLKILKRDIIDFSFR